MKKEDVKPGDILKSKDGHFHIALLDKKSGEIIITLVKYNETFKNKKFVDPKVYYTYQALSDYDDNMRFGIDGWSIVDKIEPHNLFFEKQKDGLKVKNKDGQIFTCYFTPEEIIKLSDGYRIKYRDFKGFTTTQESEGGSVWEERHKKHIFYFILCNNIKIEIVEECVDINHYNATQNNSFYIIKKNVLLVDGYNNKNVVNYNYLIENYEII